MTAKNLMADHAVWISSAALIAYSILGVFLNKASWGQVVPDLLFGLAGLGLHFNLNG